MRQRQLQRLWARLEQLPTMSLTREALLMKLGAARAKAPAAWRLDRHPRSTRRAAQCSAMRSIARSCAKCADAKAAISCAPTCAGTIRRQLWRFYIQLIEVEAAFKNLKDDLQLRPIHHQLEQRIEAHIFVAFLAYCLHVTLRARLKPLAAGLTPRAVLDKLAAIQMLDVHFPTTDGRTLILSRHTEPNADQKLSAATRPYLPPQPPPRITAAGHIVAAPPSQCSGDLSPRSPVLWAFTRSSPS